ncbi:uncharacterized protein LOC100575747 [Acyrthosiphon pisum]|uniref:Uncharacterized protein n=1 Tax=Acyrthosiphon pisum TaxID=7029 RepID=A0A8R2A825_ACYPI|nr:uncharacterized protein LOC100575747 [Acyrthosiphon pisum]|eukprot:XP_003248149.1 PREDICTED: uncharacterized protein LOC100575747 [Acyrthosiphon pisum]
MEVVEVNDYQCHSDGEEVVLLDMDKANGVEDDSPEVHEVTVDDASGMDVIEACEDDSQDRMEITDVVIEIIPNEEGSAPVDTVADGDVSASTEASTVNNVSNDQATEKEDDSQMDVDVEDKIVDVEDKVVEPVNEVNETEEPVKIANDIKSDITNTSESATKNKEDAVKINEANNKTIKTKSLVSETKKADGSLVLTKDKISVTIPQHIAGRDMASLSEETLPRSGKRMLKPRFGVKVPYIHMTSQIVTQDEIAKELFERFQQKYPITRVDKPDKVFSMKYSHRLSNNISGSKTPDGKSKDVNKNPKKISNTKNELSSIKSEKTDVDTSSKPTISKPDPNNKPDVKLPSSTQSTENNLSNIQSPDVQESNNISKESIEVNDSKHIEQITNTLQILDQSADQQANNVSEDKNDEKISSNEELIAILEDFETIEVDASQLPDVPMAIPLPVSTPIPTTPPKPTIIKKKIIRSTTRTKRSKPKLDPELEKQIALKQLQEVSRPKRFDSLYAKRKIEIDKKLLAKNDLGSVLKRKKPTPDDVPEVKIAIDQYIKSYTDKRQSIIKVEPIPNDEVVSENTEEEIVPEIKTNDVVKARTMREINRLLGDEGAINMIYSLEKRRSPGNNNAKNILPSTRRKKKDLMLKTKLVKNAMLKMSSPATASLSSNRLGRRSDVCTPSISPENKCTRKTSIDSQGSDQSSKCLGNFSGRKAIPADESKIIRKHSSSSEASSIGGSPILSVPETAPINNIKHTPVKALRVYTRKNKNSNDILLNSSDPPFVEVSKGTNKSSVKTKNSNNQKVKKQAVPASTKLSRSLAESIKKEVEDTTYNEITLRRYDGVVHITLTPVSTVMKNALNISVMEELMRELNHLENDDTCKVVLVSSAGRIFCQGLDIAPLVHDDQQKCIEAALDISSTLKKFISCLSNFPKLLVAGVDGAAVGLGATMLVHFDLVFASDKATFETPYAQLGHIAEGAATTILGRLLVAEMIMGSQRLTAGQAHYYGLVTRTLWPDRFHDELIPLVKALARQSLQAMITSKALQKQETKEKLAKALESETHILVQQWTGDECQQNLQAYLKDAVDNINT